MEPGVVQVKSLFIMGPAAVSVLYAHLLKVLLRVIAFPIKARPALVNLRHPERGHNILFLTSSALEVGELCLFAEFKLRLG